MSPIGDSQRLIILAFYHFFLADWPAIYDCVLFMTVRSKMQCKHGNLASCIFNAFVGINNSKSVTKPNIKKGKKILTISFRDFNASSK